MAHSHVVGGSSAGRLIQCPGSRKLSEEVPIKFEGNIYTQQGTALHYACEEMLLDAEAQPDDFIGVEHDGYTITADDVAEKLAPAWEAWLRFSEQEDIDIYAEECVVHFQDLELDGAFGTADIIAADSTGKTVYVIDWKFGHKPVSPDENSQGLFYAAAALQDPETVDFFLAADEVAIVIIQPTVHDDAQMWLTNVQRLHVFTQGLKSALKQSDMPNPPYKEGPHCGFCPAKALCPLKKDLVEVMTNVPATVANLEEILEVADDIEAVIKAARKMAHDMLEAGVPIKGWKLVPKRATRRYVEEEAVENFCKKSRRLKAEDYYDQKLRSPAQLEKVCKQKGVDFSKLGGYIASISSGSTLAHESDKREGIVISGTRQIPEALAKQMAEQ